MEKMKKTLLIAGVVLMITSSSVWAAVTLSNVSGSWSNVIAGGSTIFGTQSISYGNGTENYFRSGDSSGRSGLGFTGTVPPAQSFEIGDAFEIGLLRHFNEPTTSGSSPSEADLTINMTFSDPVGLNGTFGFNFQINNTPNTTGQSPADDDIVYFPGSYASQTFIIDSQSYTLNLLGFGNSADNLLSQFSSPEGETNATKLWGRITTPQPATVPAPGALILTSIGAGLVGWLRTRKTL